MSTRRPSSRSLIRRFLGPVVALALAGSLFTPSIAAADIGLDEPASDESGLAAGADALWPSPVIPVCWEQSALADEYDDERAWVHDAATVWEDPTSNVDFTGWGSCASGEGGVRVGVADTRPHTTGLGVQLDGTTDGMVLNFEFGAWGNTGATNCVLSEGRREFCIRAIAVHEFGHALGFAHEHLRDDAPDCGEPLDGTEPELYFTDYDPSSIMNYCSLVWNNNGRLTAMDVAGVRLAYGPWDDGIALPLTVDGFLSAVHTDSGLNPFASPATTRSSLRFAETATFAEGELVLSEDVCVAGELALETTVTAESTSPGSGPPSILVDSRLSRASNCQPTVLLARSTTRRELEVESTLVEHELDGSDDVGAVTLTLNRSYDETSIEEAVQLCQPCGDLAEEAEFATPPTVELVAGTPVAGYVGPPDSTLDDRRAPASVRSRTR